MGRLQRHQKRNIQKRIAFLTALFVVVILLVSNVGISLIANASLALSNLFGRKQSYTTDDLSGVLRVDDLPTATNSAQIMVTGFSQGYDNLEFYINGSKVKKISVNNGDAFSQEIGVLKEGDNTVYVKALSAKRNRQRESSAQTITYLTKKPDVTIDSPHDHDTVNTDETSIQGSTNKDNTVLVNGAPVVVDSSGKFQTSIKLKEGDNEITVSVTDAAGNSTEQKLTVKYEKP